MLVYFSKIKDFIPNILPGYNPFFNLTRDAYTSKNINNFDAVKMNRIQITPNASNRIHEGLLWKMRQPAYLRNMPEMWIGTYFPWMMGGKQAKLASWVPPYTSVGRHFQHASGEAGGFLAQGLHDGRLPGLIPPNRADYHYHYKLLHAPKELH